MGQGCIFLFLLDEPYKCLNMKMGKWSEKSVTNIPTFDLICLVYFCVYIVYHCCNCMCDSCGLGYD